ncbi:hypothetical protein Tco_1491594 [Tanacetum coccineum]
MENYKNVSQDIRNQLDAEAEAVQIIATGIDNDIYSTVDACPNACSKQYEKSKASIILSGSSWNRLLWKDHVAANQGRSQVAFRRNTFSIRNLEGFELLKGNRNNKSYTSISLKLAYATPICLMNVLLYQVLVMHHDYPPNFNTINDLAKK